MIDEEEVYRRVKRYLELSVADRPARKALLCHMAGLHPGRMQDIVDGHRMRPERLRRLARVMELLEDDRIPEVDMRPLIKKRYRHLHIRRDAAPPCEPMMVLDLTGGAPRMVAAFVNPNTFPELKITKVKR